MLTVTIRIGGEAGSTLWDATSQVPTFDEASRPLHHAGHMFGGDGNSCQFEFELDDPAGEIPRADLTKNLNSHNQVTVIEDAPGFDCWIGRGRIADKGVSRGKRKGGDHRYFEVTVDDGNTDFRGLALEADWVRPAESGRARVLAALAAFCNGDPRLTTVIDDHLVAAGGEVSMEATTYEASTELTDIFRDCAEIEGKVWGAVIHHSAGASHLCMLYIDEEDHTTFVSGLSITDSNPDLDTEFPPIWDQGAAAVEQGGDLPVSKVVSRYGMEDDGVVIATDAGDIVEKYDYWAVGNQDSESTSAAAAGFRADSVLKTKHLEQLTHQVSIQIPADKVDNIGAGMSIGIRSAAAMGGEYLGTFRTRRIAQCKFEKVSPKLSASPAVYLAHLQLERPLRRFPSRSSKALRLAKAAAAARVTHFTPCDPADTCMETFARTDPSGWGTSELLGIAWVESGSGAEILSQGRAYLPPENGFSSVHRMSLDFTTLALPFEILMAVELKAPVAGMVGGTGSNRLDVKCDVRASLAATGNGLWRWQIIGVDADDAGAQIGVTVGIKFGAGIGTDTFLIPGLFRNPVRLWVVMQGDENHTRLKMWYAGESEPSDWTFEHESLGDDATDPRYLVFENNTTSDDLGGDLWVNSICIREGASCSNGSCACAPAMGQFLNHQLIGNGDGASTSFGVAWASGYEPGSLAVMVDGLDQNVIEDDPPSGQFSLDFAPEADELIHADWRVE